MTAEECEALLLELAAHPGGVADALRTLGIKGVPGTCTLCPIARYLVMHANDGTTLGVGLGCAWNERYSIQSWSVDLPFEVSCFIDDFDEGDRGLADLRRRTS